MWERLKNSRQATKKEALNIPPGEMRIHLKESELLEQPIYVHCHSGARSRMACDLLNKRSIQQFC